MKENKNKKEKKKIMYLSDRVREKEKKNSHYTLSRAAKHPRIFGKSDPFLGLG